MLFAIHCLDKDGVLEKRMSVDPRTDLLPILDFPLILTFHGSRKRNIGKFLVIGIV